MVGAHVAPFGQALFLASVKPVVPALAWPCPQLDQELLFRYFSATLDATIAQVPGWGGSRA